MQQAHAPVRSSHGPGHQKPEAPASGYPGALSFPGPHLSLVTSSRSAFLLQKPSLPPRTSVERRPRSCVRRASQRGKRPGGGTRILEPRGGVPFAGQPISTRDAPSGARALSAGRSLGSLRPRQRAPLLRLRWQMVRRRVSVGEGKGEVGADGE